MEEAGTPHVMKQEGPPRHWNGGVGVSKKKTCGLTGLNFPFLPLLIWGLENPKNDDLSLQSAPSPNTIEGLQPMSRFRAEHPLS